MMTEITDTEIENLRTAAGQAGDLEMVAICDRVLLYGDEDARQECQRVLDVGRAMEDE